MNVEEWYSRAFKITKGDPLYKDYVHDVYIKMQRKGVEVLDSYIYLAIHNRWIDEIRRKKEEELIFHPSKQPSDPLDLNNYNLDAFEAEVSRSLMEGYKPKEIAKICGVECRYIWSVIRSVKAKIKQC